MKEEHLLKNTQHTIASRSFHGGILTLWKLDNHNHKATYVFSRGGNFFLNAFNEAYKFNIHIYNNSM